MIKILQFLFFSLLASAVLISCQEEVVEITQPPADQVITSSSSVANLIQRTSAKDGSKDNIIDMNSCTTVVLPVTVIIDGTEIVVESPDQFGDLEKLLDEIDDDDKRVEIVYPIILSLPDYTEVVINNDEELKDLEDDCNSLDDDDIECIDFQYPLTISVYDANSQQADVITIEDDEQFYAFLDLLDEAEFFSFNFPITVILWDGSEVSVSNNDDLEDLLEDAIDDCDEDDDNDFDDDDVDDSEFVDILITGSWQIGDLNNDGEDNTSLFEGYTFRFFDNGEVLADNGEEEIRGTWSSSGDDGIIEFEIKLEATGDLGDLLELISDEWEASSYSNTEILLVDDLDNSDDDSTLKFIRA